MQSLPRARFLDPSTPPTMITLVILASMGALSMNIFLPSMPAIQSYFGASPSAVQFLLSGFLFMNGILQLIIGPLSDRFGRRPVALWAFGIFILASVVCANAPNTATLVTARTIQAVVVASFVLSRAAARDIAGSKDAASLMGYIAMGMSVAPMLGPTIGGFLQEAFGWTAPFWTLAILGSFVLFLIVRDMGETNLTPSSSMAEQVKLYPQLFTSRRFWGYALANMFASGVFFSLLGGAPFVGTEVYGLTPSTLGLYFIFGPMGYFCGSLFSGRYAVRMGTYRMLTIGSLVTIFGMILALVLVQIGFNHPIAFFGCTAFIGIGNGMVIPSASAGMMSINPKLAGTAAGLGGSMMTSGGGAMSALVVIFLSKEAGATPLILFMLASALIGLLAAIYTIRVEYQMRKDGEHPTM
ncbi:multidrug effflux MFS transporter [Amylibacter sp. IMCC11727]|uniref:multidrug effflux MFS transporter n=1 Tax=Amylibacter sp. IMCC11727 TaxID=3039851 RepID=UPI00244E41AF|nr:multidrug effflux MFS transporter [Amylibacter sp. IMCC11727]WGI20623.1 multidrug effflux MFS transporter [Amylibacter sp. IMCC11727]